MSGFSESSEATFPVLAGPDLTFNGDMDAFVAKVSVDGTGLDYAGYIGGGSDDYGYGIAVDAAGGAYIAGGTYSPEVSFPVTVGPDLTWNGSRDGFVAKVEPDGRGLVYAGYVGGSTLDNHIAIAVNAAGNAYVTGATQSTEGTFPVMIGPDLTYNGGTRDAIVAKVEADGTGLVYAGYVGGSDREYGYGIALDAVSSVYLAGVTMSSEATFPVMVGPDLSSTDGDAFVAKVVESGCLPSRIERLLVSKPATMPDTIALAWLPDSAAAGYNVWYVTRKDDIDLARQSSSPPAIPVAGCAVPTPAAGVTCTDVGAVSRDPSRPFFYQVRAYCDAVTEGP